MNRAPFFSTQPARGWRTWGALVPVLAVLFVALPLLGMSLLLERLSLADAGGEPIGFAGLVAFLLLPFAAITLVGRPGPHRCSPCVLHRPGRCGGVIVSWLAAVGTGP